MTLVYQVQMDLRDNEDLKAVLEHEVQLVLLEMLGKLDLKETLDHRVLSARLVSLALLG